MKREEIIGIIRRREDRKLLDFLYKKVFPKVRRYVTGNSGNQADSEDVFQEAVLVLYKQVAEEKYDNIQDFEGFLMKVSKNIWINKARRLSRFEDRDFNDDIMGSDSFDPLVKLIMEEKWQAFDDLFQKLGEKCRELLTYSVFDKLSMDEIAVKMSFTNANAAKTNNYRCKQKLADLVMENQELANLLQS